MKIIIDIPKARYIALQMGMKHGVGLGTLEKAVLNGEVLSEEDAETEKEDVK